MLRELCASGDVRTILVKYLGDGNTQVVRRIRPSEWQTIELDIVDEEVSEWAQVSLDDLEYWLEQQEPDAEPQPKDKKDEAIAKRLKAGIVPGSDKPWKTWCDLIRNDIGAKATDIGCSDVRIEKVTRAMMGRLRKVIPVDRS
jgi:hypothetical protein